MGKQKAKAKTEESATPGVSSGKWSVTRNLPSQEAKAAQSQNKWGASDAQIIHSWKSTIWVQGFLAIFCSDWSQNLSWEVNEKEDMIRK